MYFSHLRFETKGCPDECCCRFEASSENILALPPGSRVKKTTKNITLQSGVLTQNLVIFIECHFLRFGLQYKAEVSFVPSHHDPSQALNSIGTSKSSINFHRHNEILRDILLPDLSF